MSGFDRRPGRADAAPHCEYVVRLPDGTLATQARLDNETQVVATAEIWGERLRQLLAEGHALEHDDAHDFAELARFAAAHALAAAARAPALADNPIRVTLAGYARLILPPGFELKHQRTARRHLVIAARAAAEIERIDRAERRAAGQAAETMAKGAA